MCGTDVPKVLVLKNNKHMSITEHEIYDAIYPKGSVYISSISKNPKDILGFGTWVQVVDKYIYGLDPSNPPETEGGSTHMTINMMPEHNHNISETTNTTGEHTHTISSRNRNNGTAGEGNLKPIRPWGKSTQVCLHTDTRTHSHSYDGKTAAVGKSSAEQEKLLPAYRSFYIWYRTDE